MYLRLFVLFTPLFLLLPQAFGQGTAFTYQGRLTDGGGPANGIYDFRFTVYGAVTNGNAIAGPLTNAATGVSNGLFTAALDFGPGVFSGSNYWLEIAVQKNGGGFVTLSPRQPITPAPYAIMAGSAGNLLGTLSAGSLSGAYSNAVTLNNAANFFSGNGSGLTGITTSQISGTGAYVNRLDARGMTNTGKVLIPNLFGNALNLTNLYPLIYNVRDFGAGHGNIAQDSLAISNAIQAAITSSVGAAVFFPAGQYYTTNLYVFAGGTPFDIIGSGSASTIVHFFGTNATMFSFTTIQPNMRGITFIAGFDPGDGAARGNGGTNNCFSGISAGTHLVWNDVQFVNFRGIGAILDSDAGSRFDAIQCWYCGTGISLFGYDDGTLLNIIGYENTNAIVDMGQAATWAGSAGNQAVNGPQINLFGAHNNVGVIVGDGSGTRISGYIETTTNGIVQIGHVGGTDIIFGGVTLSEMCGLDQSQQLVKMYSPCSLLTIRNCELAGTNVISMNSASDATPMYLQLPETNEIAVQFSDGTKLINAANVTLVNFSQEQYVKNPGLAAALVSRGNTTSQSYHFQNISLDTAGHFTAQSTMGRRTVTFPATGTTYNVDLGTQYQDVNVSGRLTVALTNFGIFNVSNSASTRVFFLPGSGASAISFSSISNLFWSSESGLATAPTNIPAKTALIVDFTPEVGASRTNIWARYTLAPYTP